MNSGEKPDEKIPGAGVINSFRETGARPLEKGKIKQISLKSMVFQASADKKIVAVTPDRLAKSLLKIASNKGLPVAERCANAASKLLRIKNQEEGDRRALNATIGYIGRDEGAPPAYRAFSKIIIPILAVARAGLKHVRYNKNIEIIIPDMRFALCEDSLQIVR